MNIDSISLEAVRQELKIALCGTNRLQKVSQLSRFDLLFEFRQPGKTNKLIVKLQQDKTALYITGGSLPPAEIPTGFVMLMRKHLQGSLLLDIKRQSLEKVLLFDFGEFSLILELTGKRNNAYLVKNNQSAGDNLFGNSKILGQMYRSEDSQFSQKLGQAYNPHCIQQDLDFYTASSKEIEDYLYQHIETPFGAILSRTMLMIPKFQVRNLCKKASIDLQNPLTKESITVFCHLLEELKSKILGLNYNPVLLPDGHISPWSLGIEKEIPCQTMQQVQDTQLPKPGIEETRSLLKKNITKAKQQTELVLKRRLEDMEKASQCEQKRIKGELILTYVYLIKKGQDKVTLTDYEGNNLEVALDPLLSPQDNSQKYFKDYKRLKRACTALEQPIAKARERLNFTEEMLLSVEEATTAQELEEIRQLWADEHKTPARKNKRHIQACPLPPHKFTFNSFTILVGRNPKQNDKITLKLSSPGDIWLHAKGVPSAHVLIKTSGKVPDIEVINAAAYLAAKHSKASKDTTVDVMYTDIKNVHKRKGFHTGQVTVRLEKVITVSPHTPIEHLCEKIAKSAE